jgi:DNA excision repair protein ERCC-5
MDNWIYMLYASRPNELKCISQRKTALKWVIEHSFPHPPVYDAYLQPVVDDSPEPFAWGFPNLERLRQYSRLKFGWEREYIDGLLVPVIKNVSKV